MFVVGCPVSWLKHTINVIYNIMDIFTFLIFRTFSISNPLTFLPHPPAPQTHTHTHTHNMSEIKGRLLGGTELNWCRAVSCGTGISVLALQVSKEPDISLLQNALNKLQNAHPILKSMLHKNTNSTSTNFSFVIPPTPPLRLISFDLSTTSDLLKTLSNPSNTPLSPFRLILEHELNINPWSDPSAGSVGTYVFFAHLYVLPSEKWALVLRLHTAVCDPITAVSLLKELMELVVVNEREGGGTQKGIDKKEEVNLGIEDLVPVERAKKTLWAHGLDVLGYSISSLRLTNLKFKDIKRQRRTEVVRLQMTKQETEMIMAVSKPLFI